MDTALLGLVLDSSTIITAERKPMKSPMPLKARIALYIKKIGSTIFLLSLPTYLYWWTSKQWSLITLIAVSALAAIFVSTITALVMHLFLRGSADDHPSSR